MSQSTERLAARSIQQARPVSPTRLARRALAASIVAAFGAAPGLALAQLPTGASVVSGTARIVSGEGRMTVTNSPNAVLNWQSFSIGGSNSVRFEQANAASKVLNRVVGNDPSSILGSLSSNGEVWLVNPHGVLFGNEARIDVGGLVASTLGVTNDDFLTGRNRFGAAGAQGGQVLNQSDLATSFGGRVWLVGASVRNEGTIQAAGGQVVLAAGQSIELVDSGMPHVTVRVSAPENESVNLGTLLAPAGGRIDVHGAIVNQDGIVRADSVESGSAGRVIIRAQGDVRLGSESKVSASGIGNDNSSGGNVLVESVAGKASVLGDLYATSAQSMGGRVQVLGREVDIGSQGAARIAVWGARGGGTVQIGQGDGVAAPNAANTYVSALIDAGVTDEGNGGRIVVTSDGTTQVSGGLLAAGGLNGTGKGGLIETSGVLLDAGAAIDLWGPAGGGTWLASAGSMTIVDAYSAHLPAGAEAGITAVGQDSLIHNDMIGSALIQGARVVLQAGGRETTAQTGNIFVAADLDASETFATGVALALEAHGDITIDPGVAIRSGDAGMALSLVSDFDGNGAGAIRLGLETAISTNGGNVRIAGGPGGEGRAERVDMHGGFIDASNGGSIAIAGQVVDIGTRMLGGNLAIDAGAVRLTPGTEIEISSAVGGKIDIVGETVEFTGTAMRSTRNMRISSASSISLSNSSLFSYAPGDSIVLSGTGLTADESSIGSESGRWLAYLDSVGAGLAVVNSRSLGYAFLQVGANATTAPAIADRSGVIVREGLNVRVKVDATRTYDGGTQARFSRALSDDLGPQFALQVNNMVVEGQFADKHAGTDKAIAYRRDEPLFGIVTANGQPIYGAQQSYVADITPRAVTGANLVAADKVYDATRTATISGTLSGILEGDSVSVNGATGLFDDKHVGIGKQVSISSTNLTGADARNYRLDSTTVLADITPRTISTAGLTARDKVYDGTRTATWSGILDGLLEGDNLRLGEATAEFADKAAGVGKTVTISGASLTGADANNYRLAALPPVRADITPRAITGMSLTVLDKVYDGTRGATVAGALSGILAGDSVRLDGATGLFDDKHAGDNKTVTIAGGVLGGTDAGNYTLNGATTSLADIRPRPITASGVTALDKVYDGTHTAQLSGSLTDVLPGDTVALDAVAQFDTQDVGAGKTVTITGALRSADAANYALSMPASASAAITHRPLEIVVTGEVRKQYDATTLASLAPDAYLLTGVVAGDSLAVRGPAQGSFDSANVSAARQVRASGIFDISGEHAANYRVGSINLTGPSNLVDAIALGNVGTITPATLVYEAVPGVYVGGLNVGTLGGTVSGFKGGDSLASATIGTLQWHSPVTPASTPGAHPVYGSGLTAPNYVFIQAPGNASALTLMPSVAASAPPQRAQEDSNHAISTVLASVLPPVASGAMDGAVRGAVRGAVVDTVGSTAEEAPRGTLDDAVGGAVEDAVASAVGGALPDRSSKTQASTFEPIVIGSMDQSSLAQILTQRRDFKRKTFADAIYKLAIDPSLADVRPCARAADASSGTCRITPAQLALIHAARAQTPTARGGKARIASVPQIERKIALFIGINDYGDKNIPPLQNSIPDADAVGKLFADKLGYDVHVLHNPDKAAIIRTLNALAAEARSSDSVVIYFAGHGHSLEENGDGYWLGSDATATDPNGWISNSDIARMLSGIRSKQVTLISDSCYSGTFAREGLGAVGRNVTVDDVLSKRSVVVLSSGGDEPVADQGKGRHSIFAWNLMHVLGSVKNWTPGSTVFAEVQARVRKEFPQTPKYGSVTAAGHQAGGDYLFESRSN